MSVYLASAVVCLGVFLGLSIFLFLAEKLLVRSGPCTVVVNDGEDEFVEQGGATLLDILLDHGYHVPAACGGKGACGYCKVKVSEGGGPLLPTEEPFLSRIEKKSNVRLACQVKVREDISVSIPDFLEVVAEIVKNKTYDPDRKWRFIVE